MGGAFREEKLFDEACTALRKMRYNLAFDLFTEVMELVPENPDVHYNRGLAAGHLFKWEEARRNFSMALRLGSDPAYFFHRAIAHLHLRLWEEALADLDIVLDLESGNELARIHRRDLLGFLEKTGRGPGEVPDLCREWFDERLEQFIGVDPEIVAKADRAGLREHIARALEEEGPPGCDHTFRVTEEWAFENRRDPKGVCRFLYERGMRCDCQILEEGRTEQGYRGQPGPAVQGPGSRSEPREPRAEARGPGEGRTEQWRRSEPREPRAEARGPGEETHSLQGTEEPEN